MMERLKITGAGVIAGLIALAALWLATPATRAEDAARTVATGAQFDAYLRRCFRPPAGSAGSEITLVFAIDQNGALKGKPKISYSRLVGDLETQKAFVAAALAMLQDCTPVPVTRDFGLMAANKLRAWRLLSSDRRPGGSI
jgi:hypothetical protein